MRKVCSGRSSRTPGLDARPTWSRRATPRLPALLLFARVEIWIGITFTNIAAGAALDAPSVAFAWTREGA